MKWREMGWLLDMDGTLWMGEHAILGAQELIALLNQNVVPYMLFTNNSSHACEEYSQKAQRLGFEVHKEQILTSSLATIMQLKKDQISRIFLLAPQAVKQEFESHGLILNDSCPEAVVLAFDTELTYSRLCQAHDFLLQGLPWYATHPDWVCPVEGGSQPDCGSMIALLEASSGRKPKIIGKPYAPMAEMAAARLGKTKEQLVIVGDRLYTDMRMGKEQGMNTILVLSGETLREEAENSEWKPDKIVSSVGDLAHELKEMG